MSGPKRDRAYLPRENTACLVISSAFWRFCACFARTTHINIPFPHSLVWMAPAGTRRAVISVLRRQRGVGIRIHDSWRRNCALVLTFISYHLSLRVNTALTTTCCYLLANAFCGTVTLPPFALPLPLSRFAATRTASVTPHLTDSVSRWITGRNSATTMNTTYHLIPRCA